MAYFSNSSEADVFAEQCSRCRYGQKPCPIAWVQGTFNYDACNNKTATAILDALVSNDGTCAMFKMDPDTFKDRRQQELNLFEEDHP